MEEIRSQKNIFIDFIMNVSALRKACITLLFLSGICLVDKIFFLLSIPLYIWSIAFILIDIFTKRKLLNIKYKQLIIAFICSSLITIIIHISDNFFENIGYLYQNILCFVLFYGMHSHYSYDELKKEMLDIFSYILHLTSFFIGISFILLFLVKKEVIMANYYFCIKDNRFVGVFVNANLIAFHCVVDIILCHTLYTYKKNSISKLNKYNYIYYISLLALNLFALFLTDSNGGMLLLTTYSSIYLIQYVTAKSVKLSKRTILKRFIVLILLLIVIISGFIVLKGGLQQGFSEFFNSTNISFEHLNPNIDSGRLQLYTQGIAAFMKAPIFGNGIRIDGFLTPYLHNGYLTLLVSFGLSALNIFLIFLYILIKNMLKYMFTKKQDAFPCLLSFILAYLVYSFIEITLICNFSFTTVIFWLFLGYAANYMNNYDKHNIT